MLSNNIMYNITKPYIFIKKAPMIHNFVCST